MCGAERWETSLFIVLSLFWEIRVSVVVGDRGSAGREAQSALAGPTIVEPSLGKHHELRKSFYLFEYTAVDRASAIW